MVALRVCREGSYVDRCELDDTALNWGSEIRDALLTTEEVARERGRVEIDDSHKNKLKVEGALARIAYIPNLSVIQMGELKGKLTGLSINVTQNSRSTTLNMDSLL